MVGYHSLRRHSPPSFISWRSERSDGSQFALKLTIKTNKKFNTVLFLRFLSYSVGMSLALHRLFLATAFRPSACRLSSPFSRHRRRPSSHLAACLAATAGRPARSSASDRSPRRRRRLAAALPRRAIAGGGQSAAAAAAVFRWPITIFFCFRAMKQHRVGRPTIQRSPLAPLCRRGFGLPRGARAGRRRKGWTIQPSY